ncbi:MAG: transcriptional regulator, partial [Actinomycetia bacterium]|nr:transcriptional regulator [Actinomycetes bacterium]
LSNLGEMLIQNQMAAALLGDKSGYTGLARSEIYRWFTDPAERSRYPEDDRDRQSRAQVANLRAAYGSMGARSRAGELVRALQKASSEFASLWERHEVAQRFADHKTLIHPELGAIEVDCQVLFTEDQSQALLVLTAAPRTESYDKLQLLAVLGHERFAGARLGRFHRFDRRHPPPRWPRGPRLPCRPRGPRLPHASSAPGVTIVDYAHETAPFRAG